MSLTPEELDLIRKVYMEGTGADLSEEELDEAADLLKQSPEVEEAYAWGSDCPYSCTIHGVPGAYLVMAPELDDDGPFATLEEARNALYGNGLDLYSTEEEVWAWAEAEGLI